LPKEKRLDPEHWERKKRNWKKRNKKLEKKKKRNWKKKKIKIKIKKGRKN
jgi:hypothetical protein